MIQIPPPEFLTGTRGTTAPEKREWPGLREMRNVGMGKGECGEGKVGMWGGKMGFWGGKSGNVEVEKVGFREGRSGNVGREKWEFRGGKMGVWR